MKKTSAVVFIALIIILVIAGAVYYTRDTRTETDLTPREEAQQQDALPTQTINLKHQYKDGTHIFMGIVETPTPCYNVTAVILPGDVAEIKITTKEQEGVEMCAQVVTEKTFKVTHVAAEDAPFLATVNDEPVNINQFDIDADVDIEKVEIMIKG
jgi:hypothetical protein